MSVHYAAMAFISRLSSKGSSPFPRHHRRLSALRVHDEGLKVWVELRHQGVHKVLNGGPSLQHPCHAKTQRSRFQGVCVCRQQGKEKKNSGEALG